MEWPPEPRKKTCGLKKDCGRCANCTNREYGRIWDLLHEEDQDWVREQLVRCMVWAGQKPPPRDSLGWRFLGAPSLCEYVLR